MAIGLKRLLGVMLCGIACPALLLGQAARPAILKVEYENFVVYFNDETSYPKLATNPERTTAARALNFRTSVDIGDIVSVNGQPAKGTSVCRTQYVFTTPDPNAGQGVGDFRSGNYFDCIDHILQPDGTEIGAITIRGRGSFGPAPGATSEQLFGSVVVTGGNGAFLGVRGQYGELVAGPTRSASVTEDPSRRKIIGGGKVTGVYYLIPMSRPEVVMTVNGPAVVHSSDFSLVTPAKPAKFGEILTLFASGLGPTRPGVDPGQPFPASPPQMVNSPVQVLVNGNPGDVLYAGGYPGAVDGYQVNFRVPDGTTAGRASLQLTSAWIAGSAITIPVQ